MKKYAVLLAVALLLMMVAPTFAYNSASGSVVDSLNSDPWLYGGEVWIYDTNTGNVCATGTLDASGAFNFPLNGTKNDFVGLGITTVNCTSGYLGSTLEILIDFNCGMGFGTCNPPQGYPGTYTRQFTQNAIPISYNAGYIYTGTGPTAVTLQGIDGTTGSLPIAAGLALVLLAGLTMFVVRRRQV